MTGLIVSGLNHVMHPSDGDSDASTDETDPPKSFREMVEDVFTWEVKSSAQYDRVQSNRSFFSTSLDVIQNASLTGLSGMVDAMTLPLGGPGKVQTTKLAIKSLPKGFKYVKQFGYQHGQKVYEYGGKFFSKDVDQHNGGAWKVFKNVGGQLKRIGTADKDLNIFKQ